MVYFPVKNSCLYNNNDIFMVSVLFKIISQWNISDFLSQHREKIRTALEEAETPANEGTNDSSSVGTKYEKPVPPSDRQWMCLYSKLGELCVDPRPAVRKSAGQTLFSTINAHGSLLENVTWYTVLWQVITPFMSACYACSFCLVT